uniref:FAD-binding PCMH-type domain-containing protein n=1 Tax=Leersia perrieri TaxID=77586 RepID=A0A0D9WR31_9ORYZ
MATTTTTTSRALALVLLLCAVSPCCLAAVDAGGKAKGPTPSKDDFLSCLAKDIPPKLLYAKGSPSYSSVLVSTIRNLRYLSFKTVNPVYIVTPTEIAHIKNTVLCGRRYNIRIRVRSGGHDYEGLSYRSESPEPFAIVDLNLMRSVRVDGKSRTAWVESGAQLGDLYYEISKASPKLAFPAGVCPTIGVGGHFSGGGFGMLLRKYGVAADNVIDAKLVDANGKTQDRKSMGEDHFWAIRGGGGESFGIVVSWKVNLLPVPPTVTVFQIPKTLNEGAIDLLTKWQELAPALPDDLMIRVMAQGQKAVFEALYLGTCTTLVPLMKTRFPELAMNASHCNEMPWVQSIAYIHLGKNATVKDILNRTSSIRAFGKYKSDYVSKPIAKPVWETIYRDWFSKPGAGIMIMDPYGATISALNETTTPFPHRKNVLYNIQYITFWFGDGAPSVMPIKWIRDFYAFMEPYVTKNPRQAYVNYRDLDLGVNKVPAGSNVTSYIAGKAWGERYFKGNFEKLAITKGKVDPTDYFRNEQSIPPLLTMVA